MRHLRKKFTLGRETAQRKALFRSQAESLVMHGSIRTTKVKAKALKTIIEPLITRAIKGDLAARRFVAKTLYTPKAVKKLFEEIAPKYKDRKGGYTRVIKMGVRASDAAEVVKIELV